MFRKWLTYQRMLINIYNIFGFYYGALLHRLFWLQLIDMAKFSTNSSDKPTSCWHDLHCSDLNELNESVYQNGFRGFLKWLPSFVVLSLVWLVNIAYYMLPLGYWPTLVCWTQRELYDLPNVYRVKSDVVNLHTKFFLGFGSLAVFRRRLNPDSWSSMKNILKIN